MSNVVQLRPQGRVVPSRVNRMSVAEIITSYRPWHDGRNWRIRDLTSGECLQGFFLDKAGAEVGASYVAADRILALVREAGR